MNHSCISFAVAPHTAQEYSLTFINNSPRGWIFYIYQKMPNQPSNIFSLAWIASPYEIPNGGSITFKWSTNYSFVWLATGYLASGITYSAGQVLPASPNDKNIVTFEVKNNNPQFSNLSTGGQADRLTIQEANTIPNNTYSTGIGMSGQGVLVQQALMNVPQVYTPQLRYYVAASTQIKMGQTLAQEVSLTQEVVFPTNVYNMDATFTANQTWEITQGV